jgi:hypothetical protein
MYQIKRRGSNGTEIFDAFESFYDACFWLMNYRYVDENASYWLYYYHTYEDNTPLFN